MSCTFTLPPELIKVALTGTKSVILHLLSSFLYFFTKPVDDQNPTKPALSPKTSSETTKNKSLHPTDPKLPHYIPPNFICSADKEDLLRPASRSEHSSQPRPQYFSDRPVHNLSDEIKNITMRLA